MLGCDIFHFKQCVIGIIHVEKVLPLYNMPNVKGEYYILMAINFLENIKNI